MATDVVTWARLRAPIARNSSFVTLGGGATDFNVTWKTVAAGGRIFVATDNSPLRTYRNPFWPNNSSAGGPLFLNSTAIGSMFPAFGEFQSITGGEKVLPDDQISQLVGQTVSLTGETITMTTAAFDLNGQSITTTGGVISVGNLIDV